MKAHKPEYGKMMKVSIGLSILLVVLIESLFHIRPVLMFLKVGVIIFLIGTFWAFFEKKLWRWNWVRKIGYFQFPPDLNGRWEGKLQRVGEPYPHLFVLEIVQTYSHIEANAYSTHSQSHSLSATLLTDDLQSHFLLINTWACTTRDTIPSGSVLNFYGTSIIEISKTTTPLRERVLQDAYFTNRHPQTKGTSKLHWTGKQLYNSFQIT